MFFELRGIDAEKFFDIAIEDRLEKMLKNAECESDRIIVTGSDIFGVF